jgi:hypothetical protein
MKSTQALARAGQSLALAAKLQQESAAAFVASWNELLGVIAAQGSSLAQAG